jgi:mRNA interferase MazF
VEHYVATASSEALYERLKQAAISLDTAIAHEIKKTRPVLIVQNDASNRYSATTMVAPITSTVRLPLSPVRALLQADAFTGLTLSSVALFNQIRALDRRRIIRNSARPMLWL